MTYSKPEIAVLGDAVAVIQGSKGNPTFEAGLGTPPAAYELDEE